jgi:predicted 3-demethylubiquinone-9 3-methyltransferase (glyoxalase superfamily)
LKERDKYGLSWQVIPAALPELLKDHESPQAQRVMEALLRMKKLDIRELERAAAGDRVTA